MVDCFGQSSAKNLLISDSLNDLNCIIFDKTGPIREVKERLSANWFPNREEFCLNDVPSTTSVLHSRPLLKSNCINDASNRTNFCIDSFQPSLFGSSRSGMTRCVSDANGLNLYGNKNNNNEFGTYLINDSNTNSRIASSSISDALLSPLTRVQFPSTVFRSNNILRNVGIPLSQSQSTIGGSFEQLPSLDRCRAYYSSFTPPSSTEETTTMSRSSSRQTFTVIDDPMMDTSLFPREPPIYDEEQLVLDEYTPYGEISSIFHNTNRPNEVPTYRGALPTRIQTTSGALSQKVFLGGIQSDVITEELLKHCTRCQRNSVDYFLEIHTTATTSLFFENNNRSTKLKPIQVVPWNIRDNICVIQQLDISGGGMKDWSRTIFISTLHGKMTAYGLAAIMSQVFGKVSLAQLNTDKYGYPTGTATVLFSDSLGYMRAVAAGSIDIKCECFHKLLEIEPFLRENEPCYYCPNAADNFCRNLRCLRSYCNSCWIKKHSSKPLASSNDHPPISRRQQSFPFATLN
ncbi:unnamed protein product [Didymodactylos carnosus]|uniref:Cytoplasmic polyadenylation element-binding protein ZZ domain-containing protein n=1 Tax=Didymodactylos carnosus TaxID=1234261 RepID=A0A814LJ37_9BILA|nr:unnamed protein product [Didymodactylos carnosus]CAF1197586.1 unnamed protein product [Didymodactylos carnosus]CAF3831998.1 unnamed protein product [Didymodactylos carnosus]CAF4007844.1 unnamed protein product [Didymodactylos carnosus]